jgi:hypothetical protein
MKGEKAVNALIGRNEKRNLPPPLSTFQPHTKQECQSIVSEWKDWSDWDNDGHNDWSDSGDGPRY